MAKLSEHKTDLIRLAAVALALCLSWLKAWKAFLPFDAIALAATLIGGYPMFEEAFEGIKKRRMTMEISMSIAVAATLAIGQFFTASIITFFVLFAELLEDLTVSRGRDVIKKLLELLPSKVIVRRNGQENEMNVNDLTLRDIVIVKPGARIPVDGVVLKGHSSVDQASITGESFPVEKTEGHKVLAGTINQTGVLEIQTAAIGQDTTFGKIISIIGQAEKNRAPIQKVADKLAASLVYFAFGGAIVTYALTHNIVSAISALVVAGACGVAAGTPLAILASIGRTAKEGIITKGGIHFEQLARIDTVVLDKTGTLTFGTPEVTDIESFNGLKKEDILQLAASVEQHSEHPLAEAILKKQRASGLCLLPYSNLEYLPGQGLVCRVNGSEILVGNTSFMDKKFIKGQTKVIEYIDRRKNSTETTVFVAKNQEIIGAISFADVIRVEARQAIEDLKGFGCQVILLTGDNWAIAKKIGETLQLDKIFAEMLPQQKLEKIRELMQEGRKVAMIGDGINDAPALMEATVGIAMGSGTDVALESAGVTLTTNNLMKIVEALKISRQCLRVIMFNFWGTVVVDAAGMILAFLGYLTPLFAALIHVSSELAFILNSARLFRKNKDKPPLAG
ncbi:MAG: cation-translocating P-type ATPase [Candidatus Omnitrophica bacterium]|nr:cation-translocating P-type ATPase [Candidatus Omnitrophota bacterium]